MDDNSQNQAPSVGGVPVNTPGGQPLGSVSEANETASANETSTPPGESYAQNTSSISASDPVVRVPPDTNTSVANLQGNTQASDAPNQSQNTTDKTSVPLPLPPQTPAVDMPSSPQPIQSPPGRVVTTDTEPKGSLVKKLLVIVLFLIVIAGAAFAAWRFWPKGFLGIGKPGEIVWWGLWEEESIVQPLIDEYQEKNKGVKVTYVKQSPQDYRERLMNSLAKGEGPDMFRFHNTWVPMLKNELDHVPSSVMTPQAFAETYYPVMSSDLTKETSIVGIPLGYDAIALYINEDIFTRSGKTPPTTWDDFRDLAKELTIIDKDGNTVQYGASVGITENIDNWQEIVALMLIQNGVDLSKPDKQVSLASDALAFYKQFSNVDKVWNNRLPPSTTAFAGGNVAMYFGPTWRAFEIHDRNKDLNFKTVPLPQLPKQSPNEPDISYATYWVEGVWSRSTNKDIAWDFLKFISSKESLEKLYKNASETRLFGEPYPRIDMAESIKNDPIVGSVISLAPNAKSWYLVSRTFDGETGINSRVSSYYLDLVNSATQKGAGSSRLKTVRDGVSQVLSQYGLAK
jgi:multiple sugar transport system substrate-binding protein